MENDRMLNCPKCPECGEPMIQSMCLPYCEYVCIPCGIGRPFSWGSKNLIPEKEHDKLYEKYRKDIHKLAFEKGGATCCSCNNRGGNNCETCDVSYKFKYYKKNDNS